MIADELAENGSSQDLRRRNRERLGRIEVEPRRKIRQLRNEPLRVVRRRVVCRRTAPTTVKANPEERRQARQSWDSPGEHSCPAQEEATSGLEPLYEALQASA